MASTHLLLRATPLVRLGFGIQRFGTATTTTSSALLLFTSVVGQVSLFPATTLDRNFSSNAAATDDISNSGLFSSKEGSTASFYPRSENPDYRRWKNKENEILKDIEPITFLTKKILHSDRYLDGERLTAEDEKTVVEKLLAYHPHSEDKIGCGLDFIMVDRHPQFRSSRCLFVVRTDGGWIDFSYQKCLRAYIRAKYPSYAERFIQERFKRGSSSSFV